MVNELVNLLQRTNLGCCREKKKLARRNGYCPPTEYADEVNSIHIRLRQYCYAYDDLVFELFFCCLQFSNAESQSILFNTRFQLRIHKHLRSGIGSTFKRMHSILTSGATTPV